MFILNGYASTAQLMHEVSKRAMAQGAITEKSSNIERQNIILREFWAFCEERPPVFAISPAGQVMQADGQILRHRTMEEPNGLFFAPQFGILGVFVCNRGTTAPEWMNLPSRWVDNLLDGRFSHRVRIRFARERLGQFLGMAVAFKIEDIARYMEIETEVCKADDRQIKVESELTRVLIDAFDRGALPTKSFAKETYGAAISVRGFIRAWDQAALQRKDMSKRGRRSLEGE